MVNKLILIRKIFSRKSILILSSLAIFTIAGLYFFAFPGFGRFFPKCPFFTMTHLYCPGCGSQRCLSALLHGHIHEALHQNVLVILALPIIFYRLYLIFQKRTIQNTIFSTIAMPWIVLVIVLLFAVLRNIPIYPFTLIAPY